MTQVITQSVLSTQFIQIQVTVRSAAAYDPTGDAVQFAFTSAGYPAPGPPQTWYSGSWQTDPGPVYWAQVLVGPSGVVTLPAGQYQVWLRITDSPEVPVMQPAVLVIQ